jgi:hypothetical protein
MWQTLAVCPSNEHTVVELCYVVQDGSDECPPIKNYEPRTKVYAQLELCYLIPGLASIKHLLRICKVALDQVKLSSTKQKVLKHQFNK